MRSAVFVFGLVLSGIFLWLAIRQVDTTTFIELLSNALWWPIAPIIIAQCFFFWLKAIRWRVLFKPEYKIATRDLIRPMMIGFGANNVLPFRAGEIIRVFIASKLLDIPKTLVLATLIVERVFDLIAIAIIVCCGLGLLPLYDELAGGPKLMLSTALLILTVSALTCLIIPRILTMDSRWIARVVPSRFSTSGAAYFAQFSEGFLVLQNFRQIFFVLINSLLQWLLLVFCFYAAFIAVGIEMQPIYVATTLLGIVVLGISLPSSPGFFGTIEYAFVLGLGYFGISADESLAAAAYYHGLIFGFVTLSALVCYLHYRLKGRR